MALLAAAYSSKLSNIIGETATGIVKKIVNSAAVGGLIGAGVSSYSGGDAWDGFISGIRMGAITGAISATVPLAFNALRTPPPPQEPEVTPKRVEPELAIREKTEISTKPNAPPPTEPGIIEPKWDKVRLNSSKTTDGKLPLKDFNSKIGEWNRIRAAHGLEPYQTPTSGVQSVRIIFL